VVEPQRFAIVPEWVLDLDIPDAALRLHALLLRYGGTSGARMPSRRLLAERMRRSGDSVDRAMRDLETAGLVRVEHRRRGRENLTNRYHVRATGPAERWPPNTSGRPTRARPSNRRACGRGHGCGQGGRRSAAQPKARDSKSSSPHPIAPVPGCRTVRVRAVRLTSATTIWAASSRRRAVL
jgi:DNA-binding transcriptional MocR family regulator